MKIAANGHFKAVFLRQPAQLPGLVRRLATIDHLQRLATGALEVHHQPLQLAAGQLVLERMGQRGNPAGGDNPLRHLGQRRPESLHIPGLAPPQVAVKSRPRVRDMALRHHPGREMRPPQLALARFQQGTLQPPRKTEFRQPLRDHLTAVAAGNCQSRQTLLKHRVGAIHPEAHHVNGRPGPDTGKFQSRHQAHFPVTGAIIRCRGLVAAHGVMIGDGKQADTPAARPVHQLLGTESAVRGGGVGVEVNQHKLYTP